MRSSVIGSLLLERRPCTRAIPYQRSTLDRLKVVPSGWLAPTRNKHWARGKALRLMLRT
jgi:hypothetical protein